MVKLRIWGTDEEIEKTLTVLRTLANLEMIKLLSVSGKYADRGESAYRRVYCDVAIDDRVKELQRLLEE